MFCNYMFYTPDYQIVMLSRHILLMRTPAMLTVPSFYVLNWLLAHHKFSIPSLVPIFYKYLVRSASIISPKIFLESHLPRSTIGSRTFTVSPAFPCRNFSLASLVILKACVCRLLFTFFFQLSCSFAEHILMKNGLFLLPFLWMAHLPHMFLTGIPILTLQHQ